ncbi:hypothetical protein AAFF_G00315540 [Aldrovandia affinis]|uniref:Uncharacterized protein n=1 Tax=Aldrovandia affinis TaxID=143900 RepID=A0AAD7SN47_9TELE|nr:hypothetical protein AAFF_G00315540 [Aldrovandia affinis]
MIRLKAKTVATDFDEEEFFGFERDNEGETGRVADEATLRLFVSDTEEEDFGGFSIIVYDRQTLLNIRASLVDLPTLYAEDGNAHHCLFPRLPEGVWAPRCGSHRKKRLRRRGKRAGALVKLRDLARSCSISPSSLPLHLFDDGSDQRSCYFHRRSMEPKYASLRPVWPVQDELPQAPLNIPARLRVKRGGLSCTTFARWHGCRRRRTMKPLL